MAELFGAKNFSGYANHGTCYFKADLSYDPQTNKTTVTGYTETSFSSGPEHATTGWYGSFSFGGTTISYSGDSVWSNPIGGRRASIEISHDSDGVPITPSVSGYVYPGIRGQFGYRVEYGSIDEVAGFNASSGGDLLGSIGIPSRAFRILTIDPGNGSSPTTEKHAAGYVLELTPPSRDGYTFSGWSLDGAGSLSGNTYTYGSGNATVTAQWTANPHTVTVTAGSDIASVSGGGTYSYGDSVTVSAVLGSAVGYTYSFLGWYDGSTKVSSSASYTFTLDDADVSLTARGTRRANSYQVAFNPSGGSGTMRNETFSYDSAKALDLNAFTNPGYKFIGWATSPGSTTVVYTDGQSVSNLAPSGVVTLYAVWRLAIYQLSITTTKSSVSVNRISSPVGGATGPVYPGASLYYGDRLRINFTSDTGYTVETSTMNGVDIADNSVQVVPGDVALVVSSVANNYLVVYDGNPKGGYVIGSMPDQSFEYDVSQNLSECRFDWFVSVQFAPNYPGAAGSGAIYSTTARPGWALYPEGPRVYLDGEYVKNLTSEPDGRVTLYAAWNTVFSAVLPSISRTGYSLKGWYDSSVGGTKAGDPGDRVYFSKDTNFYAQWELLSYPLSVETSDEGVVLNVVRTESPIAGAPNGLLHNGDTVYYGDVLSVSFAVDPAYQLKTATVNGVDISSQSPYTLTVSAAVSVIVTVKLGALVYIGNEPYQVFIGNGSGWDQYEGFIGDGTEWGAY